MSETAPALAPAGLREAAFSGVRWTGLSAVVLTALQAVQFLVLVRLLSPGDFGVYAILMIPVSLALIFADGGMSIAILQRKHVSREHLSSLYWLNVVVGVLLFVLIVLLSPLVAALSHRPEILYLMPLAGLSLVILPVGIQFQVQLQRELGFSKVTSFEVSSAFVGSVVSISLAFALGGPLALVVGQVAGAAARSVLFAWHGWHTRPPMLRFRFEDVRSYLSFSLYQVGERLVEALAGRLDQLVLGIVLGINAVGYYNVSSNLILTPMTKVTAVLSRVLIPLLARLQDEPARQAKAFLSALDCFLIVASPLLFGFAAVASTLVPVALGPEWSPGIDVVRIIAVVVVVRFISNITGLLLLACGRAKWTFVWTTASLAVELPAVWFGAAVGGLSGAALGLLITELAIFAVNIAVLRRLSLFSIGGYLDMLARPLLLAAVMAGVVYWFDATANPEHQVPMLLASIALGAGIFGAGSVFFLRGALMDLFDVLPFKVSRLRPLAASRSTSAP